MEVLITILLIFSIILTLIGILGAIVPALPGPPLCLVSLFVNYLIFSPCIITTKVLVVMFILTLVVQGLDYVTPIWLTKLGGGSQAAIWGSTLGVIVGLFFLPLGIILGPLLGAFIGEISTTNNLGHSIKVSLMSLISFLLTTGMKLVLSIVMTYYSFKAMWDSF